MSDATGRIDATIDRLDAALRTAGFELEPARDPAAVDRVDRALAPYALPADLRRFWERAELATLPVIGSYLWIPCDPGGALETHRMNLEESPGLFGPPLLFPIARDSELQCSIELLADPGRPGGCVAEFTIEAHRLLYPTFTDLVEVYAELIEEGRYDHDGDGVGWLHRDAERARQDERWQAAGVDGLYEGKRELDTDPRDWPGHWRASAGIEEGSDVPLGTTHTIAALVRASAAAPLRARIAGRIIRLVGVGGDTLVVVDDGTGAIDVWCPAGVSAFGPMHASELELGVTVERAIPPLPDVDAWRREIQTHGLAGRIDEAGDAVAAFAAGLDARGHAVVATDIRPLD